MGTNYYLRTPGSCPSRCDRWVHLGKSSMGWTFAFRAYPGSEWDPPPGDAPVVDFASWSKLLDLGEIYNEYSDRVSKDELLELIENKRGGHQQLYGDDFLDPDGNRFVTREFS